MQSRDDEIETFKTQIDLSAFAEAQGYVIDRRRTSRTSIAMRHEGRGDRIIVALNSNGHHIYASIHDPTDQGSIIDFAQKRGGAGFSIGHVRKQLRPWVGIASSPTSGSKRSSLPRLEAVKVDLRAVQAAFEAMTPITDENIYLTGSRGIPAAIYGHERFRGRLRIDDRQNVIFPHVQAGGALAGYEIKNEGWTGFASGGVKRLFCSGFGADDTHLIICESGIDLLSHASLFGIERRRFLSTAGALNPEQLALLRSAIEKLPDGAEVLVAVDADDGGDVIAEQIEEIHASVAKGRGGIRRDSPPKQGMDWNDVICAEAERNTPTPPQI